MTEHAYDVVILGTGPAGLQAAIHAGRAKTSVLVMGRPHKSSLYRAHVENYCCLEKQTGEEILSQGVKQAETAGAEFLFEDVLRTESAEDGGFVIDTESGRKLHTRALVLAMGVTRNRLGVPGEKALIGKGVSYCVDCDANFYKNQTVAVVGDESAAAAGALTLMLYASDVHLITKSLEVNEKLAYQIRESGIHLHEGRKVTALKGTEALESVELDNGEVLPVDGVFIETGAKGAVELAAALGVALDPERYQYIVTDKQQQTNIPGIYAAGDICGPPWQMAKAVGEGCVAGLTAAKYAKKQR